jgi:1-acyl-sn-glycerol-3-phosphate acyltransferase
MLYRLLKLIIGLNIRIYYREVRVKNRSLLQQEHPMILISNHPNTLMDAWMMGYICRQPIYFMAKATFFDSKFKMWLLKSLKMIPINRVGEGTTEGVSNQDSFSECYRILQQGKTLVIFPEGTSLLERHLRELKSGTARIALEAEAINQGKLGLRVVPVGLNYTRAEKFRSSVFVNIGQPILVSDYLKEYEQAKGKTAKKMTEQFRVRLEQLIVTSNTKKEEYLVDEAMQILQSKYTRQGVENAEEEYKLLRQVRDRLEEFSVTEAYKIEEISSLVNQISWETKKLNIRADFLDRRFRSRMFLRQLAFSIFFVLLALPIYFFGMIHNYLQFKVTDVLVPKITKEPEYCAPIAILIGCVLYPSVYAVFMYLFADLTHVFGWKVIYFLSMPFTGLFAYLFYKYMLHIGYKWKYIFLMINKKEALNSLKESRDKLKTYFE